MSQTYDTIVLGAGAMGSATAYQLARAGQRVLVLEQFELDHKQGSSYGYSRVIRYAYSNPIYTALARFAYEAWHELEDASGEHLLTPVGGLDIGRTDTLSLRQTINTLADAQIPHEMLNRQQITERFPQFQFEWDDLCGMYQPNAGVLAASKCVMTQLKLAQQLGATVLDNTPVTSVVPVKDGVKVNTDDETYSAARLVITGGAWNGGLLRNLGLDLPLTPTRCVIAFFDTKTPQFNIGDFPVFILHEFAEFPHLVYGLPNINSHGIKLGFHGGDPARKPADINYEPNEGDINALRAFLAKHIPNANGDLKEARVCLYTMTPTEDFIVDKHPEFPQFVFGAGYSGHGFKFSALMGKILSQLAIDGESVLDISTFAIPSH